jgi:tetrapyrrole methylase family protein/MazG family protein
VGEHGETAESERSAERQAGTFETPAAGAGETSASASRETCDSPDKTFEAAYADAVADRPGAPGAHPAFDDLVRIVWRLRQPDGCPWDREQTHGSIAGNMIEEAYEAVDAIEGSSRRHLAEELGDVLMQVVLQSQIGSDEGEFTVDDVIRGISEKLVRRHPHVFGGHARAASAQEALATWSEVKLSEHRAEVASDRPGTAGAQDGASEHPERPGLLDSVPTALPALTACQKISRKAAAAGFEWDSVEDVWTQVRSEIDEYNREKPGTPQAQMEFGDILFALVNVARKQGIDAETALRASNAKFRRRWEYMERKAWESGRDISDLSNSEQEALWAEAKSKETEQ